MVLPYFSDRPSRLRPALLRAVATARRPVLAAALLTGLLCASGATGCATVEPQDKEYLADPAMRFGSGGEARAHEEHVFNNREASFGAGGVSGGGCGCN